MKNLLFTALFVCSLVLFSSVDVRAQQAAQDAIAPQKKALIQEMLEITGVKSFGIKLELSSTDIGKLLTDIVDKDRELNDEQRVELRKSATEARTRLEKNMRDYMADKANSDLLFAEVAERVFDTNFTESELQEVVTFYRTPAGQKAAKFMTTFVSKISDAYTNAFTTKFREYVSAKLGIEIDQLKQKIKETKVKKLEA